MIPTTHQVGMFLGLAVHDTSQAIGSALTYGTVYHAEEVVKVTAITKLSRNLLLAAVIPGLTYTTAMNEKKAAGSADPPSSDKAETKSSMMPTVTELKKYIPGFVLGFVCMSVLRTAGDVSLDQAGLALGILDTYQWKQAVGLVGNQVGSHYLLGTAMAALGLSTSAANLRGVGPKPFLVGLAGAGVVGITGFASTMALGTLLG